MMNISKMNKKSSKLLAAVVAMAMVMCAFLVIPTGESDAATPDTGAHTVEISTTAVTSGDYTFDFSDTTSDVLTLTGKTFDRGFYYNGNKILKIVVQGENTINVTRTDATTDVAAIYAKGAVEIVPEGSDASLTITVDGTPYNGIASKEGTYGIYAESAISIGNATNKLALNMDVGITDKYALAIRTAADGGIDFTNVHGKIDGGNRAIHYGATYNASSHDDSVVTFTDSVLTLVGGEKAVQAKQAKVMLVGASEITAELAHRDGFSNGGLDDEYAIKTNILEVDAGSKLIASGIHIFDYSKDAEGNPAGTNAGSATINGDLTLKHADRGTGANPDYTTDLLIDGSSNADNPATITIGSEAEVILESGTSTEIASGALLDNNGEFSNSGILVNEGIIENGNILNNNGTINNYGVITAGTEKKINNSGTITSTSKIAEYVDGVAPAEGLGLGSNMDAVTSDLPLSGYAFLQSDLTIPEGKSITLNNGALFDLNGFTLTVNGDLNVESGAQVIASNTNDKKNTIVLGTGSVNNDGEIGVGTLGVTIRAAGAIGTDDDEKKVYSSVTILNVDGLDYSVLEIGEGASAFSVLSIEGTITANINYNTSRIIVNAAQVSENLTIGTDVEMIIDDGLIIGEGASLINNGAITGTGIIALMNGASITVDGVVSTPILAYTGDVKAETLDGLGAYEIPNYFAQTAVEVEGVTGLTVSVASEQYKTEGDDPIDMVKSTMYLDGSLVLLDADIDGSVVVTGGTVSKGTDPDTYTVTSNVSIAADGSLIIPTEVDVTSAVSGDYKGIVVEGTVQYVDADSVSGFLGAQFQTGTAAPYTMYIKSFDAAIKDIATANPKKITILPNTEVEVTEGFTLASGEIIVCKADGASFKIMDGADVIISTGAKFDGTVNEVEGILKVEKGAAVSTVEKYAVINYGSDNSKTYAGFLAALGASAAGDKIDVVGKNYVAGELVVKTDVVIPADRTVEINCVDITFQKNLTIEEGATVTVKSDKSVIMSSKNATVTVKGTLEINGAMYFTGDDEETDAKDRNVNVTGKLITKDVPDFKDKADTPATNATVNGAYYVKSGKYTTSTLPNTIENATADMVDTVIVIGTVSEAGEIVLDGINMTIDTGATVTIGTLVLKDATVTSDGTLNATVNGAYGADGSTSVASMKVVSGTGVIITNSADAEKIWTNTVGAFAGAESEYTITSGEFSVTDNVNIAKKLTIDTAGTLVVTNDSSSSSDLVLGEKIIVNGTLKIEGSASVDATVSIPGTIIVAKGGDLEIAATCGILNLTGTIVVEKNEDGAGTLTVDGRLNLGTAPTTLGAATAIDGIVTLGTGGYVVVYNGDTTKMAFPEGSDIKGSQLVINGIVYATVYGAAALNDFSTEIGNLKDLDGVPSSWNDGEKDITDLSTTMADGVTYTTEIALESVHITFSIGTGISLTVDGMLVNSYMASGGLDLDIGTHTVSATFEPGYTGTINLVFNGKAVTGDTIDITVDLLDQKTVILSATGEVAIDTGSNGSSGGMSLTEILLIVLVVLIAIMAIVIAMRMMRS